MTVFVITGTGTEVGKTIVTAAVAALAHAGGRRVAVLKPAQTGVVDGDAGDLDVVRALAGQVYTRELRRYPDPLAPETAAARAGLPPVTPADIAAAAVELREHYDLVLIEGAGGLLVRFDSAGGTLADVAWSIGAPVVIVAQAGLGTLNATALTAEALRHRGIECAGVVVGSWPRDPGLAELCNLTDLPVAAEAPLLGAMPAGAGELAPAEFLDTAFRALAPALGGKFDAEVFAGEA